MRIRKVYGEGLLLFPGNFKLWVIGFVVFLLLSFMAFSAYLLQDKFNEGVLNEVYVDGEIKRDFINGLMDEIVSGANEELYTVSLNYSENNSLGRSFDDIKKYLDNYEKKERYYKLSYYDSNGVFYNLGRYANDFDNSSNLNINEGKVDLNYTDGRVFFKCSEYCQLYVVRPLSLYSFSDGYIQISISIDMIFDEIVKSIYDLDIIALKPAKEVDKSGFFYQETYYQYDYGVSKYSYDDILFSWKRSAHIVGQSSLIEVGEESLLLDLFKRGDVLIILANEAGNLLKRAEKAVFELVFNFSIYLIFVVVFFYFILTVAMKRITVLGYILKKISGSNFEEANVSLEKASREKKYDEIDVIYEDVKKLSFDLEEARQEVEEKNEKLQHQVKESQYLAEHDTLTGIFNRGRFSIELERVFNSGEPFTLISADLNHFKLVNDSLGHAAGDELLVTFSKIITNVINGYGIVGRMGGDEFSIIILSIDDVFVSQLLGRVSDETKEIIQDNSLGIHVSTSIGAAKFPSHSKDIEELSSFADVAMYENKRLKVDAFNIYTGSETIILEEREAHFWQEILEIGFSKKLFKVYTQPIVSALNHKIFSVECLCRVEYKDKVYKADGFIGHAEKSRKIILLDRYVLNESLRMGSKNNYLAINVNLSYASISNEGTVAYILKQCGKYKYPHGRVFFEITETDEIVNFDLAQEFIRQMKKHGFYFALDDFGAGFSSFSYLARLGVDYIKLDKSLIKDLPLNPSTQSIVSSLVTLSKDLNIKVIAEGVENAILLEEVSKYNFDFLQGYYFAKPKSIEYVSPFQKTVHLDT